MELYCMMTIVDRAKAPQMLALHEEQQLTMIITHLGEGTATSEHLLLYDLEQTEKTILIAIAGVVSVKRLMRSAKLKMFIDIPGNGIMMSIPLKSVSGGKNLAFLTDAQELKGGVPAMEFENELIVVVLNEGFSDQVMDAARNAGATGGTVFHAKGTGKTRSEKFFGVSLAEEKDIIYILAPSTKKSHIMKSVTQACGTHTPVGAICFSLPVTEVSGFRRLDED